MYGSERKEGKERTRKEERKKEEERDQRTAQTLGFGLTLSG